MNCPGFAAHLAIAVPLRNAAASRGAEQSYSHFPKFISSAERRNYFRPALDGHSAFVNGEPCLFVVVAAALDFFIKITFGLADFALEPSHSGLKPAFGLQPIITRQLSSRFFYFALRLAGRALHLVSCAWFHDLTCEKEYRLFRPSAMGPTAVTLCGQSAKGFPQTFKLYSTCCSRYYSATVASQCRRKIAKIQPKCRAS